MVTPDLKLLSETENCLQYTPEFQGHAERFPVWRARLLDRRTDSAETAEIRSEIIALRRDMRLAGYDLSLGLMTLRVDGFRNDDSMAEGFCRVVLCFQRDSILYQTGSDNHVALWRHLEALLLRSGRPATGEVHYLWYRKRPRELVLSGSATESREALERLARRAEANPLKILTSLKNL